MNTVKNYATIHLQLNQTNVLEVVILSMTYLIQYVFQNKTEDLNTHVFNIVARKMNQKFQLKTYHPNVNVNLMKENVIQIRSGIMINIDAKSQKHICKKDQIWNPASSTC